MSSTITTSRLSIDPLTVADDAFIFELLNTQGWITFIGNRNIQSREDAVNFIKKILGNSNLHYSVVRLAATNKSIGLITLIKRDYLDHHDIGFAFLPAFSGKGYAYEAANTVLQKIIAEGGHTQILATTLPQNEPSIRLIKKLGLQFREEITEQGELLHVYGLYIDKQYLN